MGYIDAIDVNDSNGIQFYKVKGDKFYNSTLGVVETPALLFDKETNVLLKHGESKDLQDSHRVMWKRYMELNFKDVAESLVLVVFDDYMTELTNEEVCTIMNYFIGCTGVPTVVDWFLNERNVINLKSWIIKMQGFGY